ncbi:MAG: helix-turn-helix domain-containing protein [Flavobacteriaceae bacterium]|nr:helix-turn-helix domain-containing protein [Flavobacteriaceae bacterium]
MAKNLQLELAVEFIEKTNRNLFITGKAGTGKTTFLHKIKMESMKRLVVVAPTGVAAINAKGVTIHSFFQLPFGVILPNRANEQEKKYKFNKTKIDIIKSLDLLIIDEVSMVRADVLDGIDTVLKRYRKSDKPFGGVQVVMIGDLQQLSPVVRQDEWELLKEHYNNAYFFSSLVYQKANVVPIEFTHIYRQTNEDFISILNEVRNDCLSEKNQKLLEKRYNPNIEPNIEEGYITLTTHNRKANKINELELDKLDTKSRTYRAEVKGNFSEYNYPTDEKLVLKEGAQVMFIKNDSSIEKRYYNGKIGVVKKLEKDKVFVESEGEIIETTNEVWENIKYSLDKDTKEISEKIDGTYSQIPLRLAWAITIHKSQGLTFDKAIIDAESSFAHGQTYVALSRCRSLEGLVLKTPIRSESIINDRTVHSFTERVAENEPDQTELQQSVKNYQLYLLEEIFEFQSFLPSLQRLINLYFANKNSLVGNIIEPLNTIKEKGVVPLLKVSNNFKLQLQKLSEDVADIEKDTTIQERFQKAITYFKEQVATQIVTPFEAISFSTENKAVEKDFEKQLQLFEEVMRFKNACFNSLSEKFNTEQYLKIKAKILLDKPTKTKKKKEILPTTSNLELFEELRMLRKVISETEDIPPFQVFTQKTLYEMCETLPTTPKQLRKVNGMGKIRVEKYGDEIIEIIENYCKNNDIEAKEDIPLLKSDTKQISFEMFNEGLSVAEIAEKRGLTSGTIESHLTHFVEKGKVDIKKIIEPQRVENAIKIIENNTFSGLSELRELTGNDYSFNELRMIVKYWEFLESGQ